MKFTCTAAILLGCFIQSTFAELKARIVADRSQITTFLQEAQAGPEAKLVFCEGGKIYFIDFSEDQPSIRELVHAEGAVLPVISPDGNHFVYSMGVPDDGETALKSSAYIAELATDKSPVLVAEPAYVPRFVQNSTTPKVVYSTCASNTDASRFAYDGCGGVYARSFVNGLVGDAESVWSGGSYFGGLSYDEKYLCTAWLGNGKAYMLNLKAPSPAPELAFLKLHNQQTGADTILPIGACNPSISSSRTYSDAMMFVDFGYDHGLPPGFASGKFPTVWEQHEYLWITRSNGDVLRCTGQKYTPELDDDAFMELSWDDTKGQSYGSRWDFPEWSNHPYLAVAGVIVKRTWKAARPDEYDDRQMIEHIYLINLKTSTVLPVVSVTDTSQNSKVNLKWPGLWTSVPQNFSEEPDWLATTSIRHRNVKASSGAENVRLSGNMLVSRKPVENVMVYDLSGKCLWSGRYNNRTQNVVIPEKYLTNKVVTVYVQLERCSRVKFRSIKIN